MEIFGFSDTMWVTDAEIVFRFFAITRPVKLSIEPVFHCADSSSRAELK